MSKFYVKRDEYGNWVESDHGRIYRDGFHLGMNWDSIEQAFRERDVAPLRDDEMILHFEVDPQYGIHGRVVPKNV